MKQYVLLHINIIHTKKHSMKKLFFAVLIAASVCTSCKNKKAAVDTNDNKSAVTTTAKNAEGFVAIDMTSLKDETSYLQAWEKFTDARIADEKKQKEDKSYEGYYTEYLDMYTALLKSTTAFSTTIPDASARVAFNEKVSAIQDKMYTK